MGQTQGNLVQTQGKLREFFCEECVGILHKQCKTLLRDHMVRLKIMSQLQNENHSEDWALGSHPRDNGHVTH